MFFTLKHSVFPVRKACCFTLSPRFPAALDGRAFEATVEPLAGFRRYGESKKGKPLDESDLTWFESRHPLSCEDNKLTLSVRFPQEGMYILTLYDGETLIEMHEVYALESDLFACVPLRGDNHMHSIYSDGKDSPMYMAATVCRAGLDYCVITDHRCFESSLLARDYYAGTGADFIVIPGEEVHSPDNIVHIINIGGRESVTKWYLEHLANYRAAVDAELPKTPAVMGQADRYCCAASQVVFEKIKAFGGVSVLCHTHWFRDTNKLVHMNQAEDITDYLLDNKRFDVLELIAGGAHTAGTQMQISRYHDEPSMPIVGSSDAHAATKELLVPGNYTIAFVKEKTQSGIMDALREGRAIAGAADRLYGEYRLVMYGYFLLRNIYPAHDALSDQLGAKMLRYASSRDGKDSPHAKKLAEMPRPTTLFDSLKYAPDDDNE